jgi:hypothetical protein
MRSPADSRNCRPVLAGAVLAPPQALVGVFLPGVFLPFWRQVPDLALTVCCSLSHAIRGVQPIEARYHPWGKMNLCVP